MSDSDPPILQGSPARTRCKSARINVKSRRRRGDGRSETNLFPEEHDLGSPDFHHWARVIHGSGSTRAADDRSPEEQELIELCRQNKRLRMGNDTLKQAALMHARRR